MASDARASLRPPNRLASQSSPYLLQHARNPVDWYPWGDEAFREARRRDVPIFLSIGYSTCYWCHVMERESFENEATAALLNDRFVCIKVDREERPDVDDIYMAALLAMRGQGGWPMSVFLEPASLRPFWAGTYFPPAGHGRPGMPSFPDVIDGVSHAWREQRDDVFAQATELAAAVRERTAERLEPVSVGREQVAQAVSALLRLLDRADGGFGRAPKFPQPVYVLFLLDVRDRLDPESRAGVDQALRLTLDRMAIGGIHDQVGGGFHRYSVDAHWLVPHFEKMLYDQGQLLEVYARAAHAFDDDLYRRVARRTADFVLRELTGPHGAFLSAIDAEVNHREGLNYVWREAEVRQAVPAADADWILDVYGLSAGANFRDPHHPSDEPSNVLRLDARPDVLAAREGIALDEWLARLDGVNDILLARRSLRPQPGTDDKIITAWNGLMIAGLATVGRVLDEPRFTAAAARAARFVLGTLGTPDGGLLRSWRADVPGAPGFLEDAAALARGLLALHHATADASWLTHARALLDRAVLDFAEPDGSALVFYDSRNGAADLFVRPRTTYDGAIPAGASLALDALATLAARTGQVADTQRAVAALAGLSAAIAESPVAAVNSTRSLLTLMIVDAPAVERAAATARPVPTPAPAAPEGAVEVFAPVERLSISRNNPAGLVLQIRVHEPYHINAAIPGDEGDLTGLRVDIINGTGVEAFVEYPAGEAFRASPDVPELRVHRGVFELPVILERRGEWTGQPLLAVTFQACTSELCTRPTTVELDVALDPV
jgi:hypothetical protein